MISNQSMKSCFSPFPWIMLPQSDFGSDSYDWETPCNGRSLTNCKASSLFLSILDDPHVLFPLRATPWDVFHSIRIALPHKAAVIMSPNAHEVICFAKAPVACYHPLWDVCCHSNTTPTATRESCEGFLSLSFYFSSLCLLSFLFSHLPCVHSCDPPILSLFVSHSLARSHRRGACAWLL